MLTSVSLWASSHLPFCKYRSSFRVPVFFLSCRILTILCRRLYFGWMIALSVLRSAAEWYVHRQFALSATFPIAVATQCLLRATATGKRDAWTSSGHMAIIGHLPLLCRVPTMARASSLRPSIAIRWTAPLARSASPCAASKHLPEVAFFANSCSFVPLLGSRADLRCFRHRPKVFSSSRNRKSLSGL